MTQLDKRGELILPISIHDHMLGARDAIVSLVEYGDYQCPRSRETYMTIQEVIKQANANLCYVFRHFPQPQHPQAQKAAEAALCAAAQGKFWQMHHKLFQGQQTLSDADLLEYAIELELDVLQFLRDMSSHENAQRVAQDVQSAIGSGVKQLPAFFIHRDRIENGWDIDKLMAAIHAASK